MSGPGVCAAASSVCPSSRAARVPLMARSAVKDRQVAAVPGRDRAAMRALPRMTEERANAVGYFGIDDVFHAARRQLDLGIRQVHGGAEQHLGEPAAAHEVA